VTELDPDIRDTAVTFASRLRAINDEYVERAAAVDVIGLAALCREHVLLIGPPGTAKTKVLERFSRMLNARYFSYLLTRFTEPAELFGAIDVPAYRDKKVLQFATQGMLPRAEIAFLDEVFNGSSAILNTLLALMNERQFRNGPKLHRVPLITLLGASNDVPDDPVLAAFCDRFLFRSTLAYVSDEAIDEVLDVGWQHERTASDGQAARAAAPPDADELEVIDEAPGSRAAEFALSDLRLLQDAVLTVDLAPVKPTLVAIVRTLRDERVAFSDRRAVKAQKAIAATALLSGRGQAAPEDLSVLMHLWTMPHDEKVIREVIEANDVPLPAPTMHVTDINEIRYQLRRIEDDIEGAGSREEIREISRRLGRWLADVREFYPGSDDVLTRLGELQRLALGKLSSVFGE
jgi:MoxR-like ATPase